MTTNKSTKILLSNMAHLPEKKKKFVKRFKISRFAGIFPSPFSYYHFINENVLKLECKKFFKNC